MTSHVATLALMLLCSSTAWTRVEYDSNQLMMMNAERVGDLVQKRINKAGQIQAKQEDDEDGTIAPEPEALEHLKDAMRIAMSRPDQDGARTNLFTRLRRELQDLNALDEVMDALTDEAIAGVNSNELSTKQRGTYVTLLDNMLAEMKPEIAGNAKFKKLAEKIRDAKIEIPKKVRDQAILRSMSKPISPSETAEKILGKKKK